MKASLSEIKPNNVLGTRLRLCFAPRVRGGGEWGREFILPQAFLWPPELTREGRKRDREKWREEKFELLLWYWNVSVGYDSCAAKYNSGGGLYLYTCSNYFHCFYISEILFVTLTSGMS